MNTTKKVLIKLNKQLYGNTYNNIKSITSTNITYKDLKKLTYTQLKSKLNKGFKVTKKELTQYMEENFITDTKEAFYKMRDLYVNRKIKGKLSDYYLYKEQKQLLLGEDDAKEIIKALNQFRKGRMYKNTKDISKYSLSHAKEDIKSLKRLAKYFGKNSTANKILDDYQKGFNNIYQMNARLQKYVANYEKYEGNINLKFVPQITVYGYSYE